MDSVFDDYWRPISTAPMNGTEILVCNSVNYHPVSARYSTHPGSQAESCWRGEAGHRLTGVTHWRSLPEEPSDMSPNIRRSNAPKCVFKIPPNIEKFGDEIFSITSFYAGKAVQLKDREYRQALVHMLGVHWKIRADLRERLQVVKAGGIETLYLDGKAILHVSSPEITNPYKLNEGLGNCNWGVTISVRVDRAYEKLPKYQEEG